ncbi:MAG: TonB family protein, partial [Deltaproteobacteria bacterium]|nr:TonB family protein [Deltaproteobacteria bacterium]
PAALAKAPKQKEKADPRTQTSDPKKRDEAVRKPEEKVVKETPPPAAPEVPTPSTPPPPPVPVQQPPQPKLHQKIVDLDNDKEVEPPPDAEYLAQKNNRAEVETRATQTNMDREQKGAVSSQQPEQPENRRADDKEIGDERAKIAQLEEQKSKLGRAAPETTPQKDTETLERMDNQSPRHPSPVLSLRDAAPRGHEITPETVDPSLPHDPAGMLARARPRGAFRDHEADHNHEGAKRVKLALSGKDYEYLFGGEAKADRQLVQKERSTRLGKYVRGMARIQSALENFITEVKPGNQTALNTRAAPFAAFIARMHRNIHQLWGFGALDDWDDLPASSPLNDESLVTTLEIELNRDGTVNKVTMVRPSKALPFDAAAIDVVLNAAPYPEPPREIRSGNGKVYVHWSFFRDGRQCATSGVDYFILDNGPKDGDLASGGGKAASAFAIPAPPQAQVSGPRRLERRMGEVDGRRVVGESPAEDAETGTEASAGVPPASNAPDEATRDVAQAWFAAYVRGDIAAMTARATFPFRSTTGIAAKGKGELAQMLTNLVAESPVRTTTAVSIETAAGLRKLLGKLPPGLDDGAGAVFAISQVDGDMMILLLARTGAGWKISGLVRR